MAPMQQTIGATANPNTKIFLAIIIGSYNFSGKFIRIHQQKPPAEFFPPGVLITQSTL
jgi:hypothetical protein